MAETAEYAMSEPDAPEGKPGNDGLMLQLQSWFKQDITHVSAWRKEAREDFQFYAGDQWAEDDLNTLREQKRPPLTTNRIQPLVNAVVGSEINNRREVRFIPREQGDAQANEILTAAAEWFRDECGAEDEESDAFEDAVISGMGWTDTRLDFEDDPDGAPRVERINPFEMVWDKSAEKPNLADCGRLFRVREIGYEAATELTGEKDRAKLHAGWVRSLADTKPHDQDAADRYEGGQEDAFGGSGSDMCLVVEARWFERETFYRSVDISNPTQMREYSPKEFERLNEMAKQMLGQELPSVKQRRRVLRRCFIGSEILGQPDKPMVPDGMFGWEAITGYRDKIRGQFYGIVRAAKDPQRWTNKFFSQVQFLLNSQSKGGIMAERDAFENIREAEMSWAKSDQITYLKNGALSGQNPKVLPKPAAQFPNGFFALFQESKEAISQVTGLSQEFLGTREVNQPGVLENTRRQSSLNLLAALFNALRRYRKRQGRVMLHLIQKHLADGRLIRIVGKGKEQYVPLTRDQVSQRTYDIIVDDSPTSPNEKDRTWAILMQMLPLVRDLMTPEIALEMLEMSPLPASLVADLKKKAAQMKMEEQQNQKPSEEEMRMKALMEKHQVDMAGKQAGLQVDQQRAHMDMQGKAIDLMAKQQEAQIDLDAAARKAEFAERALAIREYGNMISQQRANTARIAAVNG